jgi:RimJ/RimL family protein N-acetyltransferase
MVEWDGTVVLTTPRLRLRTFRADDLPLYAAMNADREVVEFLGGMPLSRDQSDAIAEYAQGLHAREGIGLLAVERAADSVFLGMCGLHHVTAWYPDIEVAWRLARRHWGFGYATEAAAAWLRHGFTSLGLPRIISIADRDPPNIRSIAVMRRLGMVFDHDADLVDETGESFAAVVHSITPAQWRSGPGRTAARPR